MATLYNDSDSFLSYFAADGSYGDADSMVVVDTAEWTNEMWDFISEDNGDYGRGFVAELFDCGATLDEARKVLEVSAGRIFASADFMLHRVREGIDK
jgi:hypothetical protein